MELAELSPYAALLLLCGTFVLFVTEIRPPDETAFCAAFLALTLGLVGAEEVLGALANPAPATIGAMFVPCAALVRTGALESATERLGRLADCRPAFAVGAFLAVAAPRLLPERRAAISDGRAPRSWLAELFIPVGSPFIGRRPEAIDALNRGRGRVVDVICGDASLRREMGAVVLEAGDLVVVKTRDVDLMGFSDGVARGAAVPGLEVAQARPSAVVKAVVGPNSRVVGRTLRALRRRRRYGVYPLALHRQGETLGARLEDARLAPGDTLLIDGAPEDAARPVEEARLIPLGPLAACAFRRAKAPLSLAVMVAVVLLAALDAAPILPLALIGVAVVPVTRGLDADEDVGAMDGRLMLLVVSMLVLGAAMDQSGALDKPVGWLRPAFEGASPLLALALLYAVASIITELVTNNAVAVLTTPIAAGLAASLGLDQRPFVVAVVFAASASFATPIGHQTNTLAHNVGGYRFADFLGIDVPMNLTVGATTVLAIPLFCPLASP